MNIVETVLRVWATLVVLAPRLYFYYLDNFALKRVGQDVFALIGPMMLAGIIGVPLFFYGIVQLYKGIRNDAFSRLQILEISLLLLIWVYCYSLVCVLSFVPGLWPLYFRLGKLLIPALVLHYVLWLYRTFIAKRTRSIQSVHE